MKKTLIALLLLSAGAVFAGESAFATTDRPQETEPPAAQSATDDRMPTFRNHSPKVSLLRFRDWFANAYKREYRSYRKRMGGKNSPNDFQSVEVSFMIDTTGRPVLMETQPQRLSDVQEEVLQKTFESCPTWTPAVQNGRKVRFKFTMSVIE